jgi:trk system potassium uptake protein TrkH
MSKIAYKRKNSTIMNLNPTRVLLFGFILLILIGSFLLMLPYASKNGQSISFIDALFTATSASCVAGLVVADTYTQWSLFGQIIILLLVQIGAVGIITFTAFFTAVLGKKMSLRGMLLAQESLNTFSFDGIIKILRTVVFVLIWIELLGALLLSIAFVPEFGVKGLYYGLFHSISAFCNSGFDLMGVRGAEGLTSFMAYNNNPLVIYTICALMTLGGLGFIVWKDIYEYRKTRSLYLHSKVVLSATLLLTLAGAILLYVFESGNPETMANLNTAGKINASIFQSITCRNAGFNTIATDGMHEISKFITIIFMFIGAAPGSTAGGIKITTFAVILYAIISQVKGRKETIIFKKKVPYSTVNKALAITGLSFIVVLAITAIILVFEKQPFLNVLFEVTSAFGTCGLTTGLIPEFSSISKFLVVFAIFLGRVGTSTFALALAIRTTKIDKNVVYPEGKISVG